MKNYILKIVTLWTASILMTANAHAIILDLTTANSSGAINGAIYQQTAPQPTGTGYIDSFVRIDDGTPNGRQIEGYNTIANSIFDNTSDDTHNHAITLADVPIVDIGGANYRQFLLDINEPLGHGHNDPNARLISLDEVQVFLSNIPNQQTESFLNDILALADSSLVYRMDAGTNSWVGLDAGLNSGSGSGDMFLYIPDYLFTADREYVYLYSRFGESYDNQGTYKQSGGFEEWAVLEGETTVNNGNPIPEPTSMALLGSGLVGFALRRRNKKA